VIEAKSSQKPLARDAISAVARNPEIVEALFEEAKDNRHKNPIRSFVALALLGEMRSPYGLKYLTAFLALPPTPTDRPTVAVNGIATSRYSPILIWDQHLTVKAIDGLAYLRTVGADKYVQDIISKGDTLYVRALAADAYIWNHKDSEEARKEVTVHVRPGESWIRDRFRRDDDDTVESYDSKVQQWMTKHPELLPPKPKPSSDPVKSRHWYEREGPEEHKRKESSVDHESPAFEVAKFIGPLAVSASGPHCPQAPTPLDTALFNADGGATWGGYGQDGMRTFIGDDFSIVGNNWGADGFPDLSNVSTPYGMMANSVMLITYGITTTTGFTFHDPFLDYFQLAQGRGGRFKDDIFYSIESSSDPSLFSQWTWQAGPSPNVITNFCPQFDGLSDPVNRAAIFFHENWHGWQRRYHWSVDTRSGHLPINYNKDLPKGNCSNPDECDYYTLHKVSLFPPGQMEYSTTGPPDQKMHMPWQVAAEFLCDLGQQPNPGLPMGLPMFAKNSSDQIVLQDFLNPVPLGCGNRRPF